MSNDNNPIWDNVGVRFRPYPGRKKAPKPPVKATWPAKKFPLKFKAKPTLDQYVKRARPRYCPVCGCGNLAANFYKAATTHPYKNFPFWDLTCRACGFEGELEPDVPIGGIKYDHR